MAKRGKILVVDDNQGIRNALRILLPAHFQQVELIPSPKTLVSTMDSFRPDVVLLDMNFNTGINTGNEGLYWTGELKKMYPQVQIVLFTAYADIALAVEGMKRGAFDFIVKPWDNTKLVATLTAAYEAVPKRRGTETEGSDIKMYWGDSPCMQQIHRTVLKLAPTDATVLISGENGTGKDVLAREIQALSTRRNGPMVCVDAGAIPETLFESELFGHVKGAFTDAHSDHIGKFEQASGGTLFLDEIGNIPLNLQAKLLRVLQNRCITRVGSGKQIPIDIRLICASNMNLARMVEEGRFRQDLFYRINTFQVHLPPLRERPEDILPLAEYYLKHYALKYHRQTDSFDSEAVQMLKEYEWKGNVRELQNTVEKAVILSEDTVIRAEDLSLERTQRHSISDLHTLDAAEEKTIREAIYRCSGNLTLVAKELGISRPTLYSKLKRYNI